MMEENKENIFFLCIEVKFPTECKRNLTKIRDRYLKFHFNCGKLKETNKSEMSVALDSNDLKKRSLNIFGGSG